MYDAPEWEFISSVPVYQSACRSGEHEAIINQCRRSVVQILVLRICRSM